MSATNLYLVIIFLSSLKHTAIGLTGSEMFLRKALDVLTYSSLCLPENINARGLGEIPNYYYRDDGLKLWNIIHEYEVILVP